MIVEIRPTLDVHMSPNVQHLYDVFPPFGPECATRHAGDEDLCPHSPTPPHHPVQRTLYERANTEAAALSDAVKEGQEVDGGTFASLAPITVSRDQPTASVGKSTNGPSPREGNTNMGMTPNVLAAPPREAHTVSPEPRSWSGSPQTELPARPTEDFDTRDSAADADAGGSNHPFRSATCQEMSPSAGGGAKTPSTPEAVGGNRSAEAEQSPQEVDIYGRRLDRSFLTQEAKEPIAQEEPYTIAAEVGSGGEFVRAERRAEAVEATARDEAKAAVNAASEARVASDEFELLRAEGIELSRWREAVLNLRDVLEVVEREGKGEIDGGGEERRSNGDGGC